MVYNCSRAIILIDVVFLHEPGAGAAFFIEVLEGIYDLHLLPNEIDG